MIRIFLIYFSLDFVWATYTMLVRDHKPMPASIAAAGIIVLSGVGTIEFVKDPRLLIPAALGAALGTWTAMQPVLRRAGRVLWRHWTSGGRADRPRT